MEPSFHNMFELLQHNDAAWRFFYTLPFEVREEISSRANIIHTFSHLQQLVAHLQDV